MTYTSFAAFTLTLRWIYDALIVDILLYSENHLIHTVHTRLAVWRLVSLCLSFISSPPTEYTSTADTSTIVVKYILIRGQSLLEEAKQVA